MRYFRNEILKELMGDMPAPTPLPDAENIMWVLANKCGINDAVAIYYGDKLKEIADKLDSDIIILPSSIHEVIILKSNGMAYDPDALKSMVQEVNGNEVSPEERLSDSVYLYRRDEKNIMKIA